MQISGLQPQAVTPTCCATLGKSLTSLSLISQGKMEAMWKSQRQLGCQLPRAAVMKHHRPCGLKQQTFISPSSGGQRSDVEVPAEPFP